MCVGGGRPRVRSVGCGDTAWACVYVCVWRGGRGTRMLTVGCGLDVCVGGTRMLTVGCGLDVCWRKMGGGGF